jgi:uncharacterized Zn-binding protein involved in type VI secretion
VEDVQTGSQKRQTPGVGTSSRKGQALCRTSYMAFPNLRKTVVGHSAAVRLGHPLTPDQIQFSCSPAMVEGRSAATINGNNRACHEGAGV